MAFAISQIDQLQTALDMLNNKIDLKNVELQDSVNEQKLRIDVLTSASQDMVVRTQNELIAIQRVHNESEALNKKTKESLEATEKKPDLLWRTSTRLSMTI